MRNQLLVFAAVVAVSLGSFVDAQPPGGGMRRGAGPGSGAPLSDVVEKLELSAQQSTAWEAIRLDLEKSTAATRERMRDLRSEGAGPEDDRVVEARQEMQKAFTKAESDLLDILTDDQKARYKALKKEAESGRQGRGRGGQRGGPGRGHAGGF